MDRLLTDEEAWGSPPEPEMTDEEAWGSAPAEENAPLLSDEEAFGAAPKVPTPREKPVAPISTADQSSLSGDLEASWYMLRQALAGNELESARLQEEMAPARRSAGRGGSVAKTPEEIDYERTQGKARQEGAIQDVAKFTGKLNAIPESPAATKFNNSKTFGEAWANFWADPLTVTRSTTARSAAISIPSVVGGIVGSVAGPAGAAAGAGYGSYTSEFGSRIADGLQSYGADINDPESIKEVWAVHHADITRKAHEGAVIVGGVDALTASVGSKIAELPGMGLVKKEVLGTAVEGAGGALGETGAELNETGTLQPGAIAGEFLGEVGSGAVQQTGQIAVHALKSAAGKGDRETVAPPETMVDKKTGRRDSKKYAQILRGAGYTNDDIGKMSAEDMDRTVTQIVGTGVPKPDTAKPTPQRPKTEEAAGEAPKASSVKVTGEGYVDQYSKEGRLKYAEDALADPNAEHDKVGLGMEYAIEVGRHDVAERLIAGFEARAKTPEDKERAANLRAMLSFAPKGEEETVDAFGVKVPKDVFDKVMSDAEAWGTGEDGTRAAPITVNSEADLKAASNVAATDYTPAEGEANNRKLGHVEWKGLKGSIEVAAGGSRKGTDPKTGREWETKHSVPYGYWKGTKGADDMHIDAYWGPEPEADHPVYILDEFDNKTDTFRQHKSFVGFPSEKAVREAYLGTSSKKPGMIGGITEMSPEQFKTWLEKPQTRPVSPTLEPAETKAEKPQAEEKAPETPKVVHPDDDRLEEFFQALPKNEQGEPDLVQAASRVMQKVMGKSGVSWNDLTEAQKDKAIALAKEETYTPPKPRTEKKAKPVEKPPAEETKAPKAETSPPIDATKETRAATIPEKTEPPSRAPAPEPESKSEVKPEPAPKAKPAEQTAKPATADRPVADQQRKERKPTQKEYADAPTWAEVLHAAGKDTDGHPDTDKVFKAMATIAPGVKKYLDLTPAQQGELLAAIRAAGPSTVVQANIGEPDKQAKQKAAVKPISEALRVAAQGFGYKIVDTGLPFGFTDHWGRYHSFGTQLIDKMIPGDAMHLSLDNLRAASPAVRAFIKEHMTAPWFHRVWFGHDPLANLGLIIDKFGVAALPEYFLGLLKDSMTTAGIPLPGVQWLVQAGLVGDKTATMWLSMNVGEALSGGLSILGTYRLYKQMKNGQQIHKGWAIAGILLKTVGGVLSANPVVLFSAAADVAILVKAQVATMKAGMAEMDRLAIVQEARRQKIEGEAGPQANIDTPAPVYYSALVRSVEGMSQPKAPAAQWLGQIKNAQGVKAEEIAWLGLEDWLNSQTGSVTKESLLDFLRANQVQVQEVMKGVPVDGVKAFDTKQQALDYLTEQTGQTVAAVEEAYGYSDPQDYIDLAYSMSSKNSPGTVKFSKYQLPGGSNYRELLLTVPHIDFASSHFAEKGIVAHVRFNERMDAKGVKTLFLEEAQSDLHQLGRKSGYNTPSLSDEDIRAFHDLSPEVWAGSTTAERAQMRREAEANQTRGGVPDAPFKTTWPELLLRRMVRWAAENDFDSLSWTPGSIQAERYDLSKQISKVEFFDNTSGGIGLPQMEGEPSRGLLTAYDLNGKQVLSKSMEPSEVENHIGKDVAKKLFEATPTRGSYAGLGSRIRELKGLDLKVGGEGMKGFYDKILVDAANKLGKKFGAKVGQTEIETASLRGNPWVAFDATDEGGGKELARFETKAKADKWANEQDGGVGVRYEKDDTVNAWSLPITPAMRDAAMQGQPLFNIGQPFNARAFVARQDQIAAAREDVQRIAQRILGRKIRVLTPDKMPAYLGMDDQANAAFNAEERTIWIAMAVSANWSRRIGHESLHALRDLNVITPGEWVRLVRMAYDNGFKLKGARLAGYQQTYARYSPDMLAALLEEEAVADLLGDYVTTREGAPFLQRLMDRIEEFLDALLSYMAGHGFNTPAKTLREAYSGKLAARGEGTGRMPGLQTQQAQASGQANTEDVTEAPAFKAWFKDSKVVDAQGKPLVVYHGAQRGDRIGNRFRKSRATSGPMPFFTDDAEIASSYAANKPDTSFERPASYAEWIKFRPEGSRSEVDIERAWHFLLPEQRANIAAKLPHVVNVTPDGDEARVLVGDEYQTQYRLGDRSEWGLAGKSHWDFVINQESRGNILKAAVSVWLDSGALFNSEEEFLEVLRLGGMPMKQTRLDDPNATSGAVFPVYLSIQKPLITKAISQETIDALDLASKRTRTRARDMGDTWHKLGRNARDWMAELKQAIAKAENSHVWTSIPDWVTLALKSRGYDGIQDTGGKYGGKGHDVWIPFEETQVKSASGNSGAFDPRDPRIQFNINDPEEDPFAAASTPEERAILEKIESNINLDYINAPEDVKQVIQDISDRSKHFIDERRGVVSNAQTAALAAELGMTPDELTHRKHGAAFNAHGIFAARVLLVKSAKRLRALAVKAKNSQRIEDLAEFQKAFTRHVAIQEQVAGLAAEAGRALQQFKMMAGDNFVEWSKQLVEQTTAKDKSKPLGSRTQEGADAVRHLADMVDGLGDPARIGRFTRDIYKVTKWDMIREIWINALLSGPQTHVVNTMSNLITALWQVPETFVASGLGRLHSGERVAATEAMARLVGLIEGSREGLHAASVTMKTGEPSDLVSRMEMTQKRAVPGIIGEGVRIPTRALMAEDEFFKAINYRAEINAQAVRRAMNEGLRGRALASRIAELKADPTAAMKTAAHNAALYNTFQTRMGKIATYVGRIRDSVPGGYVILPFLRTPANIIKYAGERTPFGFAMQSVRDNLSGKNGAVARDTQAARMLLGTAISVAVVAGVLGGMISGSGPDDPEERALLRLTGWQPYSIKLGDTWYSYQRFDPFAFIVGVTADMVELGEAIPERDLSKVAGLIMAAISGNLLDKTWLSGPSDFLDAIKDYKRYGEGYIRKLAGTLVPTGMAQWARTQDPVIREARSLVDSLKARIPGMSDELPPKRDIFGREIVRQGALGWDLISPIFTSATVHDAVVDEMIAVGYAPSMPTRTVNKHALTPKQYDDYARISGEIAKQKLDAAIARPSWQHNDPDQKVEAIRKIFDEARERGRFQLKRLYPELKKPPVEEAK